MSKEALKQIIIRIKKRRRIIALECTSLQNNLKELDDWLEIMEGNLL